MPQIIANGKEGVHCYQWFITEPRTFFTVKFSDDEKAFNSILQDT